jgi:hypothetical protein
LPNRTATTVTHPDPRLLVAAWACAIAMILAQPVGAHAQATTLAYRFPGLHGRVVADKTGRPVPTASIIVVWAGPPAWLFAMDPLHFEEATSRADGTYAVGAWATPSLRVPIAKSYPMLACFAPGYRMKLVDVGKLSSDSADLRLVEAAPDPTGRAEQLTDAVKFLLPFETALGRRARLLSALDQDWRQLPEEARMGIPSLAPWMDNAVQELRAGYDQWRLAQ